MRLLYRWCVLGVLLHACFARQLHASEIAYWAFDDNTADAVGGRNGVLLGDATFSFDVPSLLFGYSSKSLSVDGTLDKMVYDVPNGDSVSGSFTLAAWVKMDTDRPGGSLGWFGTRSPNGGSFDIKARLANNQSIRVDLGNGTTFPVISDTTANLGISEWHHVAVAVQPTQYDLYVDGLLKRHATYSSFTPILWGPNHDIAIGSIYALAQPNGPPSGEDFSGLIDDVHVFNSSLTQQEVQQLMVPDPTLSVWNTTGSGTWTDANNWIAGRIPNTLDAKVRFRDSISTSSVVTVNADITVNQITFDDSVHSYTLAGDGVHSLTLMRSQPNFADSRISVLAGTHTIAAPIVSPLANSIAKGGDGTLVLTGNSNFSIDLQHGPLTITGGGSVSSDVTHIAQWSSASSGTLTVDGTGSSLNVSQGLDVGIYGMGVLNVTNGGDVTLGLSSINSIGNSTGAVGTATISGAGSTWNGGSLIVGIMGTGGLSVQNGGSMSVSKCSLGLASGGVGTATITGPGSSWSIASKLAIGGDVENDISGGFGSVTVASSGAVNVGGTTTVYPNGSLNLPGGTFATAALDNHGSITLGGTLSATNGLTVASSGVLKGSGTIVGNVSSGGRIAPGNSPGIIDITGNFTQQSNGILEIEVGGTSVNPIVLHDQVRVAGTATLEGRLEVPMIAAPNQPLYLPQVGDTVTFLTATGGVNGKFGSVFFPNLPTNVAHKLHYNANDVQLEFVSPEPIQFVSADTTAIWSVDNTWRENGAPAVPVSNSTISVQNQIDVPQRIVVATASESVHQLNVGNAMSTIGDSAEQISVRIDNSNLSVAAATTIVANGSIELGDTAGGHLGTLTSQAVTIQAGGTLLGNGTVVGNLSVGVVGDSASAILAPGKSPISETPAIAIEGNYQQAASGDLKIEVDGRNPGDFSSVAVTQNAQLGGTLTVDVSQLQSTSGNFKITILTAGTLSFGSAFQSLKTLGNNDYIVTPTYKYASPSSASALAMGTSVTNGYGAVELDFGTAGDISGNGSLGPEDIQAFAYWLGNPHLFNTFYDKVGRPDLADLNGWVPGVERLQELGDNRLDFGDIPFFIRVLKYKGIPTSSASIMAAIQAASLGVPEPSSTVLLLSGILAIAGHPRRSRAGAPSVVDRSPGALAYRYVKVRNQKAVAAPARGFSLVELLVSIAIIGVLLGILLPAVQAARESSRRNSCANNLKQIGVALQNYHSQYGRFPAGSPLHRYSGQTTVSWRVLILPFMEESNVYHDIDPQPEGGAGNWAARTIAISSYQCPSSERIPQDSSTYQLSHYCGVMGAGRDDRRWDHLTGGGGDVYIDGIFYPGSQTRIAQIEDGTSHTLAIGERTYFLSDWMYGSRWGGGLPPTKIWTGSTNNIRYPINADLNQFGHYVGDTSVPPDQQRIMMNDLFFGSRHPSGAQFCFADGSVHMIPDTIDFTLFGDMATIAGKEPNP